jgi:hypothetical protein
MALSSPDSPGTYLEAGARSFLSSVPEKAPMAEPKLIIKKRPRGEYEIGTFTDDGAIVARVVVWDGNAPDQRTEGERENAALARVNRLVKALEAALARN